MKRKPNFSAIQRAMFNPRIALGAAVRKAKREAEEKALKEAAELISQKVDELKTPNVELKVENDVPVQVQESKVSA